MFDGFYGHILFCRLFELLLRSVCFFLKINVMILVLLVYIMFAVFRYSIFGFICVMRLDFKFFVTANSALFIFDHVLDLTFL